MDYVELAEMVLGVLVALVALTFPFLLPPLIERLARKRRREGTPDLTPSQIRSLARHALFSELLPWFTFPFFLLVGWVWNRLILAGLVRPYVDGEDAWLIAGCLPLVSLLLGSVTLFRIAFLGDYPRTRIRARTGIGLSWWACCIVLASAPVLDRSLESAHSDICRAHMKTLYVSLELYAADHDGLYPPAATWADAAAQYVEEAPRYDAAAFAFFCPNGERRTSDYAFNAALGEVALDAVVDADQVVVLFESDVGRNAAGGPELLPDEPRHLRGDRYLFADGSTRWIRRKQNPDGSYAKGPEAEVRWEVETREPEE